MVDWGLGGITKTIETMEESLRENELRPFEKCKVKHDRFILEQFERGREIENRVKVGFEGF